MASPVGVPLPSAIVLVMMPFTVVAFPGMIWAGIASVTEVAEHSEPSPSGNSLSPHDTEASVAVMTAVMPATTASQRVWFIGGTVCSIIDFERSSTSSTSAGLLDSTKFCCAHSPLDTSGSPAMPVGPSATVPALAPLPIMRPPTLDVAPVLELAPLPLFEPLSPPELAEQANNRA